MNAPLISIVMRSFNEAWALKETLPALAGQDYPQVELIVIDSGSTDGSQELIHAARPAHFIQITPQEYNPSRVMNQGMTKKASVEAAYSSAVKAMGGLDISLNVAGVCVHQPAEDITEKNWDFVIDVNMKGILFCTQEAGKYMIPQKSGSIINIASMSGTAVNVPQKQAPYNASKAGVMQLSKSFAVEWGKTGVRVNTISPGYTRTEMTDKMAAMFAEWEANTPMGRMCTPAELVGAMIYLASNASSYTTGSDIIVDGGYTAR